MASREASHPVGRCENGIGRLLGAPVRSRAQSVGLSPQGHGSRWVCLSRQLKRPQRLRLIKIPRLQHALLAPNDCECTCLLIIAQAIWSNATGATAFLR